MPSVEHVQQKYQNNRAENSHQPTRLRENVMRGFNSSGHAQRFLSAFRVITSRFLLGRHLYGASAYRGGVKVRFAVWEGSDLLDLVVNRSSHKLSFILPSSCCPFRLDLS